MHGTSEPSRRIIGGHTKDPAAIGRAGVALGIPALIGQEDIVNLHAEVVALVAEVNSSSQPGQHALTQELPLDLAAVGVERLNHPLATVRVAVDPQQARAIGRHQQAVKARVGIWRRKVAPGASVERQPPVRYGNTSRPRSVKRAVMSSTLPAHVGGVNPCAGPGYA